MTSGPVSDPPPRATSGSVSARPSALRIWLLAARPATLPAALAGVVVGLGAALGVGAAFRPDTALGCVAVALLLQVVANFANDLSDFRRGADTADRTGPVRVAAAGLVSERQLEGAIAITIGLAGVVGLWLAAVGGPVIIALGLLAVVAALAYTGGPWPYGYRGLGEVFVFVFFGLVAVIGTAYLQAGRLELVFAAAAIPVGTLTTGILVVNNLRDIPTDRAAGKRTLAVMLGAKATQAEYTLLLLAAYVVPVALFAAWTMAGAGPSGGTSGLVPFVLLPLLALSMASPLLRVVRTFHEPRELNLVLKGTARLSLVFSLLFALGLALAGLGSRGVAG
jgi:1,4-dihydroxy-2-naphthoate octaprenyltransferase